MRRALCLAAFLVAGGASAQDKPKPNTLTPQEVADGWILLFDGETTFGWKIDGTAEVKDGMLIFGDAKARATATFTTIFETYEARLEVEGLAEVSFLEEAEMRSRSIGLFNGKPTAVAIKASVDPMDSRLNHKIDAGADGVQQLNVALVTQGRARLRLAGKEGKQVMLKSAKLRPLGATPLFNGKDLTGWKVFAGEKYKSKFAVTPQGELSVKDGPGDLQTEKAFGDFVLQLECKTNGKALNSGVFFRCLADQYQQGYEAQIQNAYKDNDRTKPADYGTGAIYRRVPARKVVANDNEWFTMTVVADGKHVSTWVNGYQTVDWTDDRPADENARKGYRAGKGHLSIQGHDPTTDLLFRNIRIAELK
jgi:hypothetical protein